MIVENENEEVTSKSKSSVLLKTISLTRWVSAIPVFASLVASLLMILLGVKEIIIALAIAFDLGTEVIPTSAKEEAILRLLQALDDFLIGLVFLSFAYGIYELFINFQAENLAIPQWLKAKNIATLKKSLLEVLVVLLSILFVKRILEAETPNDIEWKIIIIPLSIIAIALSTRLMSEGES